MTTSLEWADFRPISPDAGTAAFGAHGCEFKRFAPMYRAYKVADVPREFWGYDKTLWNVVVAQWFFAGLKPTDEFVPKDGIDTATALRHVGVVLHSFEPAHEVKEAIAAFLLSLWFDDFKPSAEHDQRFRTKVEIFKRRAAS